MAEEKRSGWMSRHLPSLTFTALFLGILVGLAGFFIYAGVYNIGADAPHSRFVYNLINSARDNSIASFSKNIVPPKDLSDPKRIAAGAGLYSEMCTGCHLGPGLERTEMSQGLYPQAPEFARGVAHSPAQQFWIIKHGIKLTAMPAWGKTHDDQLIWDMVAFINQLPKMTPEQYKAAVASAPEDHEEMMKEMEKGHAEEAPAKAGPHKHPAGEEHHH